MKSGGLFAGYGGLDMAIAAVFGAEPAWFSEIEEAPTKILAHHWPSVPNLGDITKVDWDSVERVDVMGGGFPCQDVSTAGQRAGMQPGNRSGLWTHMAYGISKLRPRYVVAENVRGLLSAEAHSDVELCPWCLGDGPGEPALRALGAVLADLSELGYDARWCGLRAADVGAPHGRYRIFVVARDTADLVSERGGPLRGFGSWNPWPAGSAGGSVAEHAEGNTGRINDREPGTASDPQGTERRGQEPGDLGARSVAASEPGERPGPTADATCDGRHEGRAESERQFGRSDAPECGSSSAAWGDYGPAIQRWERVLGRAAPAPTEPNKQGAQRLSPRFVEWMMGLPDGHVTDVPGVTRNEQLKALGNGVVPQQAAAALRFLLEAA